ncbi:MAG: tetratricopeptide repeat protein [Bacteroidota bacterium]|nr:tetratricopeptide repeat protein [Bacteroidota bacterium]
MEYSDNNDDYNYSDDEAKSLVKEYEARLELNQAILFGPDEFEVIVTWYFEQARIKKADRAMQMAINEYPNHSGLLCMRANLYVAMGKKKSALHCLKQALVMEPQNIDVIESMAELFQTSGKPHIALKYYDKISDLGHYTDELIYSKASCLIALGRYKSALRLLNNIIQEFPNKLECWLLMGECFEVGHQWNKAAECYDKAIEINPYDARSWFRLSTAYYQQSDYEKSAWAAEYSSITSKSIIPFAPSLYRMVNCYLMLEDWKRASEKLEEIVAKYVEDDDSFVLLGDCYRTQEMYHKSRKAYQKAKAIDPNNTGAYYGLGLLSMIEEDLKNSEYYFKRAWTLNERPEYAHSLGQVYLQMEDNELYEHYSRKAYESDSEWEQYTIDFAYSLYLNDNTAEAIALCEKDLADNSNWAELWALLAGLHYEVHHVDKGDDALYKSLRQNVECHKILFDYFWDFEKDERLMNIINTYINQTGNTQAN